MKNLALLFLLLFLNFSLVFANGGVVDENYFKKTGNIRLLQKADISLLKEDLRIKIVSDTTFIEATYFLKNNGNTQSVHYGFPVDLFQEEKNEEKNSHYYMEALYFEAFLNQKTKKTNYLVKENFYEDKHYNKQTTQVTRQWHVLTLDFEKETTQKLTVKYAVQNYGKNQYHYNTFYPHVSERRFVYDLFPSSSWSDGVVQDFSLKLDLSDLKKHECSPKIIGLEGLKNKNEIYTLSTKNFDLKKKSFISISYDNSKRIIAHCLKNYYEPFPILSISSSAENAEYLIDNDPKTVWKGKEGDWIKITLPKVFTTKRQFEGEQIKVVPLGIAFLNGNYSSEEKFETEGKVKEFKFEINDIGIENIYNGESFFSLPNSVFLPKELVFEGLVNSFDNHLGLYYTESTNGELPQNEKGEDKYIQTIYIKIKKSTHSDKEVAISDLYLFRETDKYLFSNGVIYLGN